MKKIKGTAAREAALQGIALAAEADRKVVPPRTMFVGPCVEFWAALTASDSSGPSREPLASRFDPAVLRKLALACGIGEVRHAAIRFRTALGEATDTQGGYGSLKIGCTLNQTVPLTYKEFSRSRYTRGQRFMECARELYMATLAWREAPEFVAPPQHFGIRCKGPSGKHDESVHGAVLYPFLVFGDHGVSLEQFFASPTSPMTMAFKKDLCLRLLGGLRELHGGGIAHGDLRAGNVVFCPSRPRSLVIIDFGLAQREHRVGLPVDGFKRERWVSVASQALGPGSVYAPEYCQGGPTAATDMWAAGALIVRIFIRDPHDGLRGVPDASKRTVSTIFTERLPTKFVAKSLWFLILDCCQSDPGNRPSAAKLAAALEATRVDPDGKLIPAGLPQIPSSTC